MIPASRLPAPPSRWPVIDLVELTSRLFADSPKVSQIALASARSPRGVEVACAFKYPMSLGATPASSQSQLHHPANAPAILRRSIGVVGVAIGGVAHQLGKNRRSAFYRVLVFFQDQYAGAFTHHEPVAAFIPWTRGGSRDRHCAWTERAWLRTRRPKAV